MRLVRDRIGPVAAFRDAVVVERLPKTRSGKILRGIMGRIADGKEWKVPATIDDPVILGEIGDTLAGSGLSAAVIRVSRQRRRIRFPKREFPNSHFGKGDVLCVH